MEWLDESRRVAFQQLNGVAREVDGLTGELEHFLPGEVRNRSIVFGKELIVGYDDLLPAIKVATEHAIAVLGFDCGEVHEGGFRTVDYSGYDSHVPSTGDWEAYVAAMNVPAENWIKQHRYGHNHGYIVTSSSQREFAETHRWAMNQGLARSRGQLRSERKTEQK